jgi:hypothetical protein
VTVDVREMPYPSISAVDNWRRAYGQNIGPRLFLPLTPSWLGNIIPEASLLTTSGKVRGNRHSRVFGRFNFLTIRGHDAGAALRQVYVADWRPGFIEDHRAVETLTAAPAAPEIAVHIEAAAPPRSVMNSRRFKIASPA